MLGYLSADVICSEKRITFRSSTKTASFKEKMMSKDKYPIIFSRQIEAIGHFLKLAGRSFGYSPILAREYSVT